MAVVNAVRVCRIMRREHILSGFYPTSSVLKSGINALRKSRICVL